MPYLTIGTCSLYYACYGQGEAIVFLHGNNEDSTYFQHQVAYFSTTYTCVVMDMRGHGKSQAGTIPYSFALFAQDVHTLLQYLRIKKVILFGFSDGAGTAIQFALQYPNNVSCLILNGANIHPWGVKWRYQLPTLWEWMVCRFQRDKQKFWIVNLMVQYPHVAKEALQSLRMPVLLLNGTKDMIRQSHMRKMAKAIPYATMCLIEGNHFLAANNAALCNETVEAFLKQLEKERWRL